MSGKTTTITQSPVREGRHLLSRTSLHDGLTVSSTCWVEKEYKQGTEQNQKYRKDEEKVKGMQIKMIVSEYAFFIV